MVSGVALLATSRARPMRASVAALLALTAPGGCGALDHGFLNAQGRVAAYERQLHIIISIVLLFVANPVLQFSGRSFSARNYWMSTCCWSCIDPNGRGGWPIIDRLIVVPAERDRLSTSA